MNGSPIKEFKPKRGLRQGDPLTPVLFLIVAKGLAGLIREALRKGLFKGVKIGYNQVGISLLQFTNDTLFFCQPNYQSILVIKTMLQCFEITSRLKVNLHKSQVGAIGVCDEDMVVFSNCLNCKIMESIWV